MEDSITTIISDAEAIKTIIDDLICLDIDAENQNRLHAASIVAEDIIIKANSLSKEYVRRNQRSLK